jgi:RimJ/RimL family protein N-acetyltransferase
MNLKGNLSIITSRNINNYEPILVGLKEDFELEFYEDILIWCGVIPNTDPSKFWQVHLIKSDDEVVGICGLYSLYPYNQEELWLGWFGVVPSKRNQGIGQYALDWMKRYADLVGCKRLMSYVGEDGQPLQFYYRNGFKVIGTVRDYLFNHPELTIDDFGYEDYLIIECNI